MVEVVGAGFGRTGTASLKRALELLGFTPCHHMSERHGAGGMCGPHAPLLISRTVVFGTLVDIGGARETLLVS
jgi:hypothetical protein